MKQPTVKRRFPASLRSLAWLGIILLVLAMPLSLARWLMASAHQTAVALVKPRGKLPKTSARNHEATSAAQKESATSRGIPVTEVPLVGVYIGDDSAAKKELEKQLEEIRDFMWRSGTLYRWEMLSFRAALAKTGMAVPDTMTEAEAAAEFLRQTQRFSDMLAQWREAVGKGPWDLGSVEINDQDKTERILHVPYALQYLLGARAEALLRTGDTDRAWSDLQTMNSSVDRRGDVPGIYSTSNGLFDQVMLTARTGVELGAWTDAQLIGISTMLGEKNALESIRREMEFQKLKMADHFAHFRENQSEIQEDFSRSESPIDKMINRIGVATTTDQQLADNLAVIHYLMDQPFTRFDPDTGFYLGESAGDNRELPHSKPSDVSFDKFYYMYSAMYGQQDYSDLPEEIIERQTTIDQTRIAAALEMRQRATGEYPESLDVVSATFGGKIPRDIATGQTYFYQRDSDGGYKLWGTGIDRTSEDNGLGTDLMWIHRPVKK